MASAEFKSVDDYLAAQSPAARETLQKVRAAILKALPGATELITYRIPTYKIGGTMVLFFAGFPKHYAIYPATAGLIDELGAELKSRLQGKATIRFSYDEAVPARLIARIAKARARRKRRRNRNPPATRKGKQASMPVTMYGIPNCDTIKKARAWLAEREIAYAFHDYKKSGIERDVLKAWAEKAGWETLLNRSGTTFRALGEPDKAGLTEAKALKLMLAQPSLIKRPVLDIGGRTLLVGFKPDVYAEALAR